MVNMTDAQSGGTRGRATTDHLLTLKEAINIAKMQRKKIYATFLDITKAYDKAWIDAIMYVMHKRGLNSKIWSTIKKLNENLTATVQTKYGPTRKITIEDSIRQGGVLSVLQYALLMDEINKEIKGTDLGIKIPNTETNIACLLWMDDVLLLETRPKEKQKLLDITNKVAEKYHIKFGKEKSQAMIIGNTKEKPRFTLGQMELDLTGTYKYLGEIINEKTNLKDQIAQIERKLEAAYQTVLAIAGHRHFKNTKMETIWKLVTTCLIPIITYGGETRKPTKMEKKKLNQMLDNIIKRILMTPTSTPREALYIETGLLDIETIDDKNRITMGERLEKTSNNLLSEITNSHTPGWWKEYLEETKTKYEITGTTNGEGTNKTNPKGKILETFKTRIEKEGESKSKIKYLLEGNQWWTPGQPKRYMLQLGRTQASTIFKARTRMLQVKNNYKNAHNNNQQAKDSRVPFMETQLRQSS